jgi:AraC family transcriptional regulator, positive regulator of tynA and feaB
MALIGEFGRSRQADWKESVMTAGWSTERIHPRDRTAYWVDQVSHGCQMDCEPQRGIALFGQATIADLAGVLQVGSGRSTAQVLRRSSRQIARGAIEFFHVAIQASGRCLVIQDGHEIVLSPGDFTLLDRSRPYQYTYNGEFSQIMLMMRQDLLLPRIGSAPLFTATRIDGTSDIGGPLSPMLLQLPALLHSIPDAARERVAQNILDLIATALLSRGERARVSSEMTLVRVKFWVETHLGANLSAERIAAECKVTARHLNRLFAREGTSLMQYVLERRLARCRHDLTDIAMRHRSIGEIAIAAGFKDLSHFSRAYRARYGQTAREDRMSLEQ